MNSRQRYSDERQHVVPIGMEADRIKLLLNEKLNRSGSVATIDSLEIDAGFYDSDDFFSGVYFANIVAEGTSEKQVLYGRVVSARKIFRFLTNQIPLSERQRFRQPDRGEPTYCLPEINMILWTFPNDPRLATLPEMMEVERLKAAFSRFQARRFWEVGAVQHEVVRYIPGKRAVFRYEIEWRRPKRTDGTPEGHPTSEFESIYGKVYRSAKRAREVTEVLRQLRSASANNADFFGTPEVLHLDDEMHAHWLSRLPGTPMTQALERIGSTEMAQIGHGLALLQQARIPLSRKSTMENELAGLRMSAAQIARHYPDFHSDLDALVTGLGNLLPTLPRLPLVPSHGSFKLAHLLWDGERIGLVDFDSMVLADPVFDLANFESNLHYLEAGGLLASGRAQTLRKAFMAGYSPRVPWPTREIVLDWHVACLLVRKQAFKAVRHLHPDAGRKIRHLLDEASLRLRRLI